MAHHEALDDHCKGPLELWRSACMQVLMRLRADTPFDPFARSCVGIRDGCLRLFGQAPIHICGAGRLPLQFLLLVQLARERWDSKLSEPTLGCSWPYFCGPSEWKALQAVAKISEASSGLAQTPPDGADAPQDDYGWNMAAPMEAAYRRRPRGGRKNRKYG